MNGAYELTNALFEAIGLDKQVFFQSLKGNSIYED